MPGGEFDALVVCGGQAPMFQFRDREDLRRAIAHFYEARKPTAALCHGTCALLDVRLSDGSALIAGKTMTGFANVEEDFSDAAVGQSVMPFGSRAVRVPSDRSLQTIWGCRPEAARR